MNCPSLLLHVHSIIISIRQADLVSPKVHQIFSSCDKNVDIVNVHGLKLAGMSKSAVRDLDSQTVKIPQLKGMIDAE